MKRSNSLGGGSQICYMNVATRPQSGGEVGSFTGGMGDIKGGVGGVNENSFIRRGKKNQWGGGGSGRDKRDFRGKKKGKRN